ncbi:MAG: hypothetical protein RLZZ299_1188 [Pseudomonadota bacterium]
MGAIAGLALVLGGCLERVTDQPIPLDPRFYAGRTEEAGAAGAGGSDPWPGYEGEMHALTLVVRSATRSGIQLDLGEEDPSSPGGTKRAGVVTLEGPGTYELRVPVTVRKCQLQAFQDVDGNGPSEKDPFASADVLLDGGPPKDPVVLELEVGKRGGPGGGGGASVGSGGVAGMNTLPPPQPPVVSVSGTVSSGRALPVLLDVFQLGTKERGGRTYLGRVTVAVGTFRVDLSQSLGRVALEPYQDLTNDSRTEDDPVAKVVEVDLTASTIPSLRIAIP